MIRFKESQLVKEMVTQQLLQHFKMIAIDLNKQQVHDADPKTTQEINFTGNLDREATTFCIIEEAKETFLDLSLGTVRGF